MTIGYPIRNIESFSGKLFNFSIAYNEFPSDYYDIAFFTKETVVSTDGEDA